MPTRKNHHIHTDAIATDRAILQTVATLSDFVAPNQQYSVEVLRQLEADYVNALETEKQLLRQLTVAREQKTTTALALHQGIAGLKLYVEGQYGSDSPALHAIGLKRRSEHKRPTRRAKADE